MQEFDRATLIRDVSSFTNHAVIAVEYVKCNSAKGLDLLQFTFDDGRCLQVNTDSLVKRIVENVEYVKYDYDREMDVLQLTFDDGRSLLVNDPEIRGEVKEMAPEQEQQQCHQAKLLMFHS